MDIELFYIITDTNAIQFAYPNHRVLSEYKRDNANVKELESLAEHFAGLIK